MSEHDWLNTEQAARMFSDHWRLRALKYEQALLEVRRMTLHRPYRAADCHQRLSDILIVADLALDKPGTEAVGAAPGWTVTVGHEDKPGTEVENS